MCVGCACVAALDQRLRGHLELDVWTEELRLCLTCWQGVLMAGRHPGGARRAGGSLPRGLWGVHERKEVTSAQQRSFSHLPESAEAIYGKLRQELSLFTVAKVCVIHRAPGRFMDFRFETDE